MSISLTKKLFITWYTLLMLATGWTIGPVLATWMPGHYFEWYPFIPVLSIWARRPSRCSSRSLSC